MFYYTVKNGPDDYTVWSLGLSGSKQDPVATFASRRAAYAWINRQYMEQI